MTVAAQLEVTGQFDAAFTIESGRVSVTIGSDIAWIVFTDLGTSSKLVVALPVGLLGKTRDAIVAALEEARHAHVDAARTS